MAVDADPALVVDERRLASADELLERVVADRRRVQQPAGGEVLEQPVDGVVGVLLVGADDAARAPLGPADDVLAAPHAPVHVGDQAAAIVERDAVERRAAVADRAKHGLRGKLEALVGRARAQRAVGARLERVAREHDRLDAALAADLDRREQEAQHDTAAMPGRRARGVAAHDLDVAPRGGVGRRVLDAVGERELGRVDDHVSVRQLAELEQLGIGEGRLLGAAAADHDDLAHARVLERVEGVVGDVGDRQLVVGEGEHARDVERHVAGADHDRALAAQVELVVAEVGVAVVPPDEIGGGVAAREPLAGDPEQPARGGSHRVDDRVVVGAQVGEREMAAELDVGEQPQSRVLRGALVELGHRFDLRVVGRDTGAHETPRGWQPLVEVDVQLGRAVAQQVARGVAARRA